VSPSDQVRVKSKDRMTVLKMAATQVALIDEAATATGENNATAEKKE